VSEKSTATERKLKQAIGARMALEDARKHQVDTLSIFSSK
jgi:hypothetical protein